MWHTKTGSNELVLRENANNTNQTHAPNIIILPK